MLRILATYNVKGGVGKTTTAVNLAYLAARDGIRTVLWDLDPQAGAGFCLDVAAKRRPGSRKLVGGKLALEKVIQPTTYENLDLLPADRSYRNMDLHLEARKKPDRRLLKLMRPLSESYDLLLMDCAPNISLVSENVFRAADALIMPVLPNPLSMRAIGQVHNFLRRQNFNDVEVLPFFSMVDLRKNLHREMLDYPPTEIGPMLQSWIPYASEVERMTLRRAPLVSFSPGGRAGLAYDALWAEIRDRLRWR